MRIYIRSERKRLFFIFPTAVLPLVLRIAAHVSQIDEPQRAICRELARAKWRSYRGLELVRIRSSNGDEVIIRL